MHRHPTYLRSAMIALLILLLVALGLGPSVSAAFKRQGTGAPPRSAAAVESVAAAAPQQQPSDLPPVLVAASPAEDELWEGGPVVLTFDQPLDPAVAGYLRVEPALAGRVTVEGTELTFAPDAAPEPGMQYTFRLEPVATPSQPALLGAPVRFTLAAASPLQVTSVQPEDGAVEVDTDNQIVVAFNRPVVPLTGVDDQAELVNPLTVEPAVEGEGRWLNTSIFAFRPATAFAGATEYTVTVDGITGLQGETLAEPFTFDFTTAAPIVTDASPTGNQVRPDASIRVEFSQPMDPESTVDAFSLRKTGDESAAAVPGEFQWLNGDRTLVFTPTVPLEFGNRYVIGVTTAAQPASRQGGLRADFTRSFSVVPLPAVQTTSPVNGATEVSPDATVVVRFSAPLSPTLVQQNISVTPLLTTTQVYSYYSDYMNELQISWFKEPRTTYTVTLGAAIGDEYGNTLGEDYVLTFTTGDYPPFVRLETERFTHFSAFSETRASLLYRNIDALNVDLYRLPSSELFQLTGSNQWQVWESYTIPNPAANRIWSRSYEVVEEENISIRQVITLTDEVGDPLPPGVYFLQVGAPTGSESENANYNVTQTVVVISNVNLTFKWSQDATSLAWLTDLRTGAPVADLPVRFYREGEPVGEGTSDADGIVKVQLGADPERRWMPILAIAGEPGDPGFAVVSTDWSSGIAVWDFGINGGWSLDQLQSYFYTDRPIYRPGQTVYWKGIVRLLQNDEYVLPPDGVKVQMTVRDPLGNAIAEEERELGPNGTLDGKFELTGEALTGGYFAEIQLLLGDSPPAYYGMSWPVAAYRKPEFEITVTPDQPEYRQGETVRVRVQATYYSGGPMANAPVTWRLISDPYFFHWEQAPRGRYFSFTPFDPDQADYDPYRGSFYLGLIREGAAKTGPDGSFEIELPADLTDAPQSQNWTFDVTVQSPTNQYVSGRTSVPIHKADYYVGLSPREYVTTVDDESAIDVVTVTPEGERYADAELEMTVYEFQWNSLYLRNADGAYRWETSVDRTPVYSTTLTTDAQGEATLTWTPTVGGQYQIVAMGADPKGNRTSSSTFVWISARDPDQFVAWPRENNDRMELVADKALYEPGDTARILVPSPFAGPVQALLTIERSGVVSAEVITLTGNSETLEIPIREEHIPNIFVGLVIAKGIDETNPTPAMRIGYVQLTVNTAAKELTIDVASSAQTVAPGESIAYTLTVTDLNGDPVADAEVSVAIVDRAVLALAPEADRKLVDVFYYQRPLGVTTSALLTINRDRMSQQLSEGAKGGGGGDGGIGMEVRSEFPDIALWRAALTTDQDGMATFTVDLPDNLTTWRLVAKAVTADTRVGDAVYDVVATKELQVRPIAPRFFTAGDRAEVGAALINATEQALANGLLTLEVTGADLEEGADGSVPFELAEAGQTRQTWPIVVDDTASQVVMTLTAVADTSGADAETLGDAVRLTLPVLRYESPETVASSGAVPPAGTLEVIRLPQGATGTGTLDVTVEPSLAGGLIGGLNYLRSFPYECNEQVVSRFLPNLFTARAVRDLGVENAALAGNLDEQVNGAVQKLVNRQNQDGGWGYWPGERSSVFITAYVLWGLATADQTGYTVPQRTLQAAVDYLERSFLAPKDILHDWQLNETAFMHFVLAEMGQGDPGRASTLFDVRERLGVYGKAYLAMALADMSDAGADDPRVTTLMDDIYGAAKLTATSAWWQEDAVDFRTLNTNIRTTAIALEAFIRLDPQQAILPQVVRWLMQTRQDGRWSNTQENAWAIMALSDWLKLTGELSGDYSWTVTLNDQTLGSGTVTPENVADPVHLQVEVADLLRDEANALRLNRDNASGRMYYTTYLRYYLDAASVEARDRGIVVNRRFVNAADGSDTERAAVGDVISVTVTLVAPTDLFQVRVDVPVPAGTEPIDPSLLTTSDQFTSPEMTLEETETGKPAWWRYWVPSYSDIRDDRVALFASFLPAGTYEYTFEVRASLAGEFRVLPAHAEQMYFTEVWGRSAGATFAIRE